MSTTGIIFSNLHDMSISDLTRRRTMASVPFGCRYRLVDFTLSNMVNAGIHDISVITHNNYRSLMDHLGSGKDWDLARRKGGLKILPPFITTFEGEGNTLYANRLEALKNIQGYIADLTTDNIIISDCDSICNIDLKKVIEYHTAEKADATCVITKKTLTHETCGNYRLVKSNQFGDLTDIANHPKNYSGEHDILTNIWVFNRRYLQSVVADAAAHGYKSFTNDVLSRNIGRHTYKVFRFDGYYANIDSMAGYFAVNMSLLESQTRKALFSIKERPIYTKVRNSPPTEYLGDSKVKNSLIADGCVIEGTVENSILFRGVHVGKGAVVKNAILFQDTQILPGASVNCIIADKNVVIRNDVTLSGHPSMPFYIEKFKMI